VVVVVLLLLVNLTAPKELEQLSLELLTQQVVRVELLETLEQLEQLIQVMELGEWEIIIQDSMAVQVL
jgi:hypothetical protein